MNAFAYNAFGKRGAFASAFGSSSATWVDPLAGIGFALRLQTHRGDSVPFGLYQDLACTIPATQDWDTVAAWRDEISGSGLVMVQTDPDMRPYLFFDGGVPTLRSDGVDDRLGCSLSPTNASMVFCGKWLSSSFAERIGGFNQGASCFQNTGKWSYFSAVGSALFDGIGDALSYGVGVYSLESGQVTLHTNGESAGPETATETWGTVLYAFGDAAGEYADAALVSVLISSPVLGGTDRATVENYLQSLTPA